MSPRVIAIDNLGEYNDLHVITGYRESIDAVAKCESLGKFQLALRTSSVEEDLELMELVRHLSHFLLIVEEASRYVSTAYLPEPLEYLIRFGRHRAIDQIYLARRATELHRDITAQSDYIVSFRQHEFADVKRLEHDMGEIALSAKDLPKFECIVYGEDTALPWPVLERKYQVEHDSS